MISTTLRKSALRPLLSSQRRVIHDLQEHVVNIGVRLFDLVEHQHGVRRLANGVGQEPALVEADIAGRRANQSRDGVLLHVNSLMSKRRNSTPRTRAKLFGELGLADAGRPRE